MTVANVQSVTPPGILVTRGSGRHSSTGGDPQAVTTFDMTTISGDIEGDVRALGPSDADLLERVRAGDRDAYGDLWIRHEPAADIARPGT